MTPLSIRSVILIYATNVLLTFTSFISFAQPAEFTPHENGLIYSPKTIGQLKYIVDSLNLKFKVCDAKPTYYAKPQTIAHYVSFEGPQCKALEKDMLNGMTLSDLLLKYKKIDVVKNIPLIRYSDTTHEGKKFIAFQSIGLNEESEQLLTFENGLGKYQGKLAGKWITLYNPPVDTFSADLHAFFITREFETPPIPQQYARWIQYADCLVDTTAKIFTAKATMQRNWRYYDQQLTPNLFAFDKYINLSRQKDSTYSLSTDDPKLKELAEAAYHETFKVGYGSDALEDYFEEQGLAERSLELRRNRIVVGGCSMDMGPREHALSIAKLSAETVKWEIFLRAHLDIMNDKFERASDGSYAWGGRQTYLRELEVLDINVADLLLGISLRISNPATNHYDGYIGRIGRALAEYRDPDGIESMMEKLIADDKLDPYNRTLIYYLFLNYNHHLKDGERRKANEARIQRSKDNLVLVAAR